VFSNSDLLLSAVTAPAGSVDDFDLLEVQVSGKSARSARHLTCRHGLMHLKSAPAGALQAAAEQAVADHLQDSSTPSFARASEDWSSVYSPNSSKGRYNRSQSHMDIPKQGSVAIAPLDSAASSSSSGQLLAPLVRAQSNGSKVLAPYLVSPAAAPAVQQTPVESTLPAQQGSSQVANQIQRLSRKISGNKLILSSADNMEAKNGEFLLPPETAPFARRGRAVFDDLEICFSGKSARMSRGGLRRPDLHTIAAH